MEPDVKVTGWIDTGSVRAKKQTDRSRNHVFAIHLVADQDLKMNLSQQCHQEEETNRTRPLISQNASTTNEMLIVLGSRDQSGVKIYATEKYVTSPVGSLELVGNKPDQLPTYLWISKEEVCTRYYGKKKADDGIQLFIRVVLKLDGIEMMGDVPFQTRTRKPGPVGLKVAFSIIGRDDRTDVDARPRSPDQEIEVHRKRQRADVSHCKKLMRPEEQVLYPNELFHNGDLIPDEIKLAVDLSHRFPTQGLIIDSAVEDLDSFPLIADMVLNVMQSLRPNLFRAITGSVAFLNMKLRYQTRLERGQHAIHWEDRCLMQSIFGEEDLNPLCNRMQSGPLGTHIRITSLDQDVREVVARDLFHNCKIHTSLMDRWNAAVRPGSSMLLSSYRLVIPMVIHRRHMKPILDCGVDIETVIDTNTYLGRFVKEIGEEEILREFIENSPKFRVENAENGVDEVRPRSEIFDRLIQQRAALNVDESRIHPLARLLWDVVVVFQQDTKSWVVRQVRQMIDAGCDPTLLKTFLHSQDIAIQKMESFFPKELVDQYAEIVTAIDRYREKFQTVESRSNAIIP
eukprot:TRINITY_DN4071_c0_g2_i4.p1 TRINITY_DN4071_c0_g2~~TRINITY_DN4071_c0_g2_i4.p1  ORF type:complete len:570 (+),score=131.44 TRINITY_DN4071_c0_g2_i4:39-1748(+)